MVRILPFQGRGPGSIPGWRIFLSTNTVFLILFQPSHHFFQLSSLLLFHFSSFSFANLIHIFFLPPTELITSASRRISRSTPRCSRFTWFRSSLERMCSLLGWSAFPGVNSASYAGAYDTNTGFNTSSWRSRCFRLLRDSSSIFVNDSMWKVPYSPYFEHFLLWLEYPYFQFVDSEQLGSIPSNIHLQQDLKHSMSLQFPLIARPTFVSVL